MKARRDTIVLSRAGETDVLAVNPGPERRGQALVWTTTAAAKGDDLAIELTPGACSNGMSDRRYAFEATVRYGGATLKGCAEAR